MNPYIGNTTQLFTVREYRITGGAADGVRAVTVNNGSGLSFTVLPDRAMDICECCYNGRNLCYKTPVGITAPQYFDERGDEWMRGFGAGFFVTCGLDNIGSSCVDSGEPVPTHGRISNTPAENFKVEYSEDGLCATLVGTMNQSVMFRSQQTLTRRITCKHGENTIYVSDTVRNGQARPAPLMLLYHFNMGYPLLSEDARLILPSASRRGRTPLANSELNLYGTFIPPVYGYIERCYYHDNTPDSDGLVTAGMVNPKTNLSVRITYNKEQLPFFVQWKMMGTNEYVCGLEPCNSTIEGRADSRARGTLYTMNPGETKVYNLKIQVGDAE